MTVSTPKPNFLKGITGFEEVVAEVKDRLGDQTPALMTIEEYAVYETVIATAFSEFVLETPTGPGRRPILPERQPAPGLTYPTVHTGSWRSTAKSCWGVGRRWTVR